MSDPLYKKELLRLAADAVGAGRLAHPDGSATAYNPACGDRVTVDLMVEKGRVKAIAHGTHACVIAQASASILGHGLAGLGRAEIAALGESVRAMLAGGGVPPAPFAAYAAFDGLLAFKSRHRCVMLPIEAALAAFEASDPAEPGR